MVASILNLHDLHAKSIEVACESCEHRSGCDSRRMTDWECIGMADGPNSHCTNPHTHTHDITVQCQCTSRALSPSGRKTLKTQIERSHSIRLCQKNNHLLTLKNICANLCTDCFTRATPEHQPFHEFVQKLSCLCAHLQSIRSEWQNPHLAKSAYVRLLHCAAIVACFPGTAAFELTAGDAAPQGQRELALGRWL